MIHIGIIPDGNRRWIKKNNNDLNELPYIWLNKIKEHLLNYINNKNNYSKFKLINEISIYICSIDNINRNDNTKDIIFSLINIFLELINTKNNKTKIRKILNFYNIKLNDNELNDITNFFLELSNNIKINIIGDIELIPKYLKDLLKIINNLNEKNINNNNVKFVLNLAIAYDYKKDIENYGLEDLLKKLDIKDYKNKINKNYDREQSDIDIVFRSGGEYRISGFFPTKILYSELFFNKKLWLDISLEDIHKTIEQYENRNRRFGY